MAGLTEEDMITIGSKLQKAYYNLVLEQKVFDSKMIYLQNRRGVFEIHDFYKSNVEEWKLAELVNGEIFRDDLGVVIQKRKELLNYYPEELWREKLANSLHEFSQYAQSNYARMMAREDYVTANLCVSKAIEIAMDIAYILNKEYAALISLSKPLSLIPSSSKNICFSSFSKYFS